MVSVIPRACKRSTIHTVIDRRQTHKKCNYYVVISLTVIETNSRLTLGDLFVSVYVSNDNTAALCVSCYDATTKALLTTSQYK